MKPMIWKGAELLKMDDIFTAALTVKTKEEAEKFIDGYVACGAVDRTQALDNIGYYAGYFREKERRFVAEMFGAMHPYFGENFNPTPTEAFEAGMKLGEELKAKKRNG